MNNQLIIVVFVMLFIALIFYYYKIYTIERLMIIQSSSIRDLKMRVNLLESLHKVGFNGTNSERLNRMSNSDLIRYVCKVYNIDLCRMCRKYKCEYIDSYECKHKGMQDICKKGVDEWFNSKNPEVNEEAKMLY